MADMKKILGDVDYEKMKILHEVKNAFREKKISLEEGQKILAEKIGQIEPHEIALIEQELKDLEHDECQKEDIQKMLDLFSNILVNTRPSLPENHPIECYYRENEALEKILLSIEDLVQYPVIKNQWYEIYDKLDEYKIHLSRKQNQLYSILETKGFDRPTLTMWTLDNFIRDEIRDTRILLEEGKEDEFIKMQETIVLDVRDLMNKEESVLYPTALRLLNEEEFKVMAEGDKEIGFAWINVANEKPQKTEEKAPELEKKEGFIEELVGVLDKYGYGVTKKEDEVFDVATGKLTLEQINLIYKHLPVDLSYVDENELVRFYSDTAHRVFPRSKNVIGRDVKNCHPRNSVHIVQEIVEKFKSGEESKVEFWINKPGLFIYIVYTAVRDEKGNFRGVLEMMQDCTHIRSLEGSQTLLTWGSGGEFTLEEEPVLEETPQASVSEDKKKILVESLSLETKLADLLEAFPWLKKELPTINAKFKMLQTPLARVMVPKATIQMMSERVGMNVDKLITAIKNAIENHE